MNGHMATTNCLIVRRVVACPPDGKRGNVSDFTEKNNWHNYNTY